MINDIMIILCIVLMEIKIWKALLTDIVQLRCYCVYYYTSSGRGLFIFHACIENFFVFLHHIKQNKINKTTIGAPFRLEALSKYEQKLLSKLNLHKYFWEKQKRVPVLFHLLELKNICLSQKARRKLREIIVY